MSHELETIIVDGQEVASFAFGGERKNIWHRLGQQFDGSLMSGPEAQRLAHMDRQLRIVPMPDAGIEHWAVDRPNLVVLDGKLFVTPEGGMGEIPEKVVGFAGPQASIAHAEFQVEDKFLQAEEAIHASNGAAVWSTAGYLRDGRQGFACMEAPPIVIDPDGIADITRSYLTLIWSYDGSRATELGSSNIRVVCANTQALHDTSKQTLIKVKATSNQKARFELAAQHWAMAQDEAAALTLQGERMLAKANGKQILKGLCEQVLGLVVKADMPKRQKSIREGKLSEIKALYHASTNMPAVGDNGYAAFQTIVEYLDWFSPVKGDDETTQHVANQFDGTYDKLKVRAADYVLSIA